MPNGFPAAYRNQFPNEKPPSWLHPASPKMKATTTKDVETASMASTSTFASTVGLVKSKLPHRSHKEVTSEKKTSESRPAYNGGQNLTLQANKELESNSDVNIAKKDMAAAFEYLAHR